MNVETGQIWICEAGNTFWKGTEIEIFKVDPLHAFVEAHEVGNDSIRFRLSYETLYEQFTFVPKPRKEARRG